MIKLLVGVLALAAVSYGELISTVVNGDVTIKTYEYTPNPSDLGDLAHDKASAWGINFSLDPNENITGAVLTGDNLYNWLNNEWNDLYINLLDNPTAGVSVYPDANMGLNPSLPNASQNNYNANYFQNWTGIELDRLNYNGGSNAYLNSQRTGIQNYNGEMVTNEAWVEFTQHNLNNNWWERDWTIPDGMTQYTKAFDVAINFTDSEIATLTSYINNNGVFGFGVDADCHFYNSGFKFTMTTETRTTNVPEPTMLSLLGCSLLGLAFIRRKK